MASLTSVNIDDGKGQPSVNSSDPEERKMARRLRINARLEAAKREKAMQDGTFQEPVPEKPLIYETIETSEDTIRQLYLEGRELITNVMVASDAKEVARRETEFEERNIRLEKLREESAQALEKLDEISNKWETILEINGPLELYESMKEQKAKCLELIEQKNNLIKNFKMELRMADEKFMKGRREMYEELSLLTKRIDEQVLLMKKAYRIELGHIEDSIDATRKETLEKHQKTWLSLYNQREKDETANIDSKFKLVESFHEELHKLHIDHEEKYRSTRIHLETDIQILEQELEQVKALCLLNSEKLDYNYQVLKKREEENVYIKNHQKRRMNKLQDMVNTLKKKIDEKRQATEEEHKKLIREVEKYYANIIATEKKAERLAEANSDKFENIWDMKDEEAKGLLEKILGADMVIHEQILNQEWTPPANTNFNKMDLPTYKTAVFVVKDIMKRKNAEDGKTPDSSRRIFLKQNESPEVEEGKRRLLRHIFELIADQSGFLIEEKLDELLKPYVHEEKTFVRLDNVLVAIGVQNERDMESLKKMFLPYATCSICDKEEYSLRSTDLSTDPLEFSKTPKFSRQQSILQIRELEEKVSKLRLQAKAGENEQQEERSRAGSVVERSITKGSDNRRWSRRATRDTATFDSRTENSRDRLSSLTGKDRMSFLQNKKCDISHPLIIDKSNVVSALKDFVSFTYSNKIQTQMGIEEKLVEKRFTISRLVSTEDVTTYWESFREALPNKLDMYWDGALLALNKYLAVLQERHELNTKAQALRRQNQDLKRLLAFYKVTDLGSKLKLPLLPPVPNEPIDSNEIFAISHKLSF